jgi:hypothetical protein
MSGLLELKLRRCPEPGRPFVNRGYELRLVQDKLDIGVQGKPMPSVVTCFWGAFGMGKSWLLTELERLHKRADPQTLGAHPTIASRLDLNREIWSEKQPVLWQGNQLDRAQLIRELWRQLASQLGTGVPNLERAGADERADAFVNQVTAWAVRFATPIIMLDTLDDLLRLEKEAFFWLERQLVERLAMTDRVLFVFTSRGELRRWKRFQVRRRVDSYRLTAFDMETAGQAVGANPDASEALYHHAFGHPLVTEYLGTALERKGIDLQTVKDAEQLVEKHLAQALLREVVEQILKAVPEQPEQPEQAEQLRRLAKCTTLLRWISIEPLRFLAEGLGLANPGRGDAYYLDRITELQAYHFLYWSSDKNNYEPDPVLRQLLTHFTELEEPEQFCTVNLAAFNFHRGHLNQFPVYLARYVPELAYHRAMLDRCESPDPQLLTVQAWWEQFLAEKAPTHPEPWQELVEALDADGELQDVLSPEDYERLHSEAKKRAAGATR